MASMTVRKIDDARYEQLQARAKLRGVSAESLAREAIHDASELTVEEKLRIVHEMQEWSRKAMIPGVKQTPSLDLIREARDE
jgi:plasmid stability protein